MLLKYVVIVGALGISPLSRLSDKVKQGNMATKQGNMATETENNGHKWHANPAVVMETRQTDRADPTVLHTHTYVCTRNPT